MTYFEVVIPDSIDEYDAFLEYFDEQLRNFSGLKRVTKIAQTEWDLSGGMLSKGRVNIIKSAKDIIVKVNAELDIVPIVIIIVLSLLIGLIVLVVALDHQKKIESEVRRAIENAKTKLLKAPIIPFQKLGKKKLFDCPGCGKALYEESNFCPYCGFKLEKCMVCNLIIDKYQEISKCPHCASLAHRDHLLEYLKIKAHCPMCGKELKRGDVV
jgi:endogenous inhibitor of DNA gyrase (YacG/DUF329 family)